MERAPQRAPPSSLSAGPASVLFARQGMQTNIVYRIVRRCSPEGFGLMTAYIRHHTRPVRAATAFTLIELLVAISIVVLLIAILLPVLGSARNAAEHAKQLSGIRQVMIGYASYNNEYAGHVMWGFPPFGGYTTIDGGPVSVYIEGTSDTALNGTYESLPSVAAQRYPWRLYPYFNKVWEVLHSHQDQVPTGAYELSIDPSLGLNSAYIGGQDKVTASNQLDGFIEDPPGGNSLVANRGRHVVFREQEVLRPSRLLVFAEVRQWSPGVGLTDLGLPYLSPPRGNGHRWVAAGDDIQPLPPFSGNLVGAPIGRYSSGAATGFFDGHAKTLTPLELEDMRYWANKAEEPDYDF